MREKLSEELINISAMLMVATERGELVRLANKINDTVLQAMEIERLNLIVPKKEKSISGILKFSQKEISTMPKEYRKEFKTGKVIAHIRKKDNGVYEIRCQIEKVKISASSKNIEEAKARFIAALEAHENEKNSAAAPKVAKSVKLTDYMAEWLETVKKPAVKAVTFKDYKQQFGAYIVPAFKGRELVSVKGFELQAFINRFSENGKNRTAKKLYNLLSALFDYAVMDEILTSSPMKKIALARYEEEHGVPLDRSEESALVAQLSAAPSIYAEAYAFMLYTGVRRSELSSVELSAGWVSLVSSKVPKGMKEKRRALPVSPMLARVLPLIRVNEIKAISPAMLTKHMKDYFPNHHAHDLRHTFVTRCQECGIQRELVSLWAGHASDSSQTSLVYTHLEQNREHQAAEMRKFDYPLI